MLVLGLNGGCDSIFDIFLGFPEHAYHDSAAILMEDGRVIAGIEEERISRIKHTNKIWRSSVEFCLSYTNKKLSDIDYIVFYSDEHILDQLIHSYQINNPVFTEFSNAKEFFRYLFLREFSYELQIRQICFLDHHTAHAAASYYLSGFESCLVLTIDGLGDNVSTKVIEVNKKQFSVLLSKSEEHSLGLLYWEVIRFLGYGHFDEYKVMGLSPYGCSDTYKRQFQNFYTLLPNGDYSLHRERIIELFEILTPRKKDEPFTQIHMDIAATLQNTLETIVFHILNYFQKSTDQTCLAISGGVGQNSSMNGKILYSNLFKEIFIPSFSGDSGCAYGAAAYISHKVSHDLPSFRVMHSFWGTAIENEKVEVILNHWQQFLDFERMTNRSEQVADLIEKGAVVGWMQGRSEFGPRALGNRSIIADPRIASHKQTINGMIKMRESYRPFAPSVLEERVQDFFEIPGEQSAFPFMSFVLNVLPEWRQQLPAVTHTDGSARLQTVSRSTNPEYWQLIEAFGRKTGIPILLNTSFNNNAEPIVDSITDGIVCYLTSGLNYLVVGDYLVHKKEWKNVNLASLKVDLPKAIVLIKESRYINYLVREASYHLVWNYNSSRRFSLSENCYHILNNTDNIKSIAQLIEVLKLNSDQKNRLFEELFNLWSERLIILNPA